jgi:hypothetical protein
MFLRISVTTSKSLAIDVAVRHPVDRVLRPEMRASRAHRIRERLPDGRLKSPALHRPMLPTVAIAPWRPEITAGFAFL